MLKSNEGKITIAGTAKNLTAELAGLIRNIPIEIAKKDKVGACACFQVLGKAMSEVAEELVEEFNIPLELLNDDLEDENDEDEEDEELDDLLENLRWLMKDLPKEMKKFLLDDDDEEKEDD